MVPVNMASVVGRRRALRNYTQPRTTRSKPTISYAEPDTDEDEDFAEEADDDKLANSPNHSRRGRNLQAQSPRLHQHKRRHGHSSSINSSKDAPALKKRRQTDKSPRKIPTKRFEDIIQTSSTVPPWHNLPYQILIDIFRYATYPLYDDRTFQSLPSARWLLKIARLCKAFAEPAFTILYQTPPLVPMDKAHMLVDLLRTDPTMLAFKYRQKVQSLRIDVGQVAAYSLQGRGQLDLFSLVKDLPRLVDLEFYHQMDMSPYRELEAPIKWSYPDALFEALEFVDPDADATRGDKTSVCKLRSWRWSSRLAGKQHSIESLLEVHLKPSFSSLRKIAFVNFQIPEIKKGAEDPPKHEEMLAHSLSVLSNLEHLIFESSTLVNSTLLPLLPTSLRNLELINCWEVTSEDLTSFLLTHGSQLRCITLNHNISLSLSFLPSLGSACPKLKVLRVNLTYYNVHSFYSDSKPEYDKLLLPDQIPVWPSTLQTIELIQLRHWDTEAAEMFFQSILDSASSLLDLRYLTIQAILNIAWRDRASFRDKWIGSLDRVFKRVSAPPKPIVSLQPPPLSPKIQVMLKNAHSFDEQYTNPGLVPKASLPTTENASVALSLPVRSSLVNKQLVGASSSRRSARTTTRQAQTGKYAESPDDSSDDEAELHTQQETSDRERKRQNRMARELATLQMTAGRDGADTPPESSSTGEDSDDIPLVQKMKSQGKAKEFIQGMCEIVKVRIDNLRPTENVVTEADFLDEEAPGDGDWNGDDDADDGYAW
ncbi:hypothetical protein B0O99DRAFT_635294 [Bisporella sp. PMI_857]|nr:hypothetical protein B0O99DRAFT_635294 [Bisporella sp. PMI_857]